MTFELDNGHLNLQALPGSQLDRVRAMREVAPSAKDSSRSWVDWSLLSSYLGQPFDNRKIPFSKLEQMRLDPMISFGLAYAKYPPVRVLWSIESERADVAAGVDHIIRAIYGRAVLGLLNDLDFGCSPGVKRYQLENPDWKYQDDSGNEVPVWTNENPMITLRPFVWLNPRRAWPHWNEDGSFGGIDYRKSTWSPDFTAGDVTSSSPNDKAPPDVPLDLAIWSTNDRDRMFDDIYGYPRTGHAYRYWWSYWYNFSLGDRAFERLADPPIVVYYPSADVILEEDNQDPSAANAMIALSIGEQARSGSTIAMPSLLLDAGEGRNSTVRGWDIDQMAVKENFDAFINKFEYLDVLKLRALWAPEMGLVEGSGGTSSRNVASVFSELFMESQAVKMEEIIDVFNRYIIPPIVQMNFGSDASARMVTHGFQRQDIDTMQAIIQATATKNPEDIPIDLRTTLDQLGVPVLTPTQFEKQQKEAADQIPQTLPPPTPIAQIQPNQARVTASGTYAEGQKSLELADQWLPNTKIYEDEVIQSTAKQLRKLWSTAYTDMYDSFAAHVGHEDVINLAEEKKVFDARNLADQLLSTWRYSKAKTQKLIDETKRILGLALERTWKQELKSNDLNADFSVDNAEIAAWLEDHGLANVTSISDTVKDELRTFLSEALLKDLTPQEMAQQIREHFGEFPDWKAKRLTRTELGKATNVATLLGFKAAGVSQVKAIDGTEHDDLCRERNGRTMSIETAIAEAEDTHPNCILHFHPLEMSEKKKRFWQ